MENKIEVKIICNACKTYFGDMSIRFGDVIKPADIRIKDKYKKKVKLKLNHSIACPKCKHMLDGIEVYGLIAQAMKESNETIRK